ncbi:MAG: TRL-like family protein [Methylobacter sp.]
MTLEQIKDTSIELKGRLSKNGLASSHDQTAGQRRVTMKPFLAVGVMSLVVGLSGCMIVDSPIKGVMGTEVIWGDIATGETVPPGSLKEGKACAESILGLLARGDASVRAAKENGNIKEVISVDHSARNLLNIVGEWCTIVRGH